MICLLVLGPNLTTWSPKFCLFALLPTHACRSRSKSRHRVPNALNRPDADLIVSASVTGNETGALMWRTGGAEEGTEVLEEDRLWIKGSNEVLYTSAARSRHLSPSKVPHTSTLPDVRTAVLAGQK